MSLFLHLDEFCYRLGLLHDDLDLLGLRLHLHHPILGAGEHDDSALRLVRRRVVLLLARTALFGLPISALSQPYLGPTSPGGACGVGVGGGGGAWVW